MKTLLARLVGGAVVLTLLALVLCPPAKADARADIKALEDRFIAAFKAKDLDAIMKVYVPDQTLFVFDVVPPRQYVGAAAYRKDWQEFLDSFNGPITFELSDLDITTEFLLLMSHLVELKSRYLLIEDDEAVGDPEFNGFRDAHELPPHRLTMLRRFFQDYKQLEGKAVEVDEMQAAELAYPIIEDALHRYSQHRRKGFH